MYLYPRMIKLLVKSFVDINLAFMSKLFTLPTSTKFPIYIRKLFIPNFRIGDIAWHCPRLVCLRQIFQTVVPANVTFFLITVLFVSIMLVYIILTTIFLTHQLCLSPGMAIFPIRRYEGWVYTSMHSYELQ